jgi:hypothetical protein
MKMRSFFLAACLGFLLTAFKANAQCGYWTGFMWTSIDQDVVLTSHPSSIYICENTTVYFTVNEATSASNYSIAPGGGSVSYSYVGGYIVFYMAPGTAVTFKVNLTTGGCTYDVYFNFITFDCDYWNKNNISKPDFKLNNATDELQKDGIEKPSGRVIQKIVITDLNGKIVREQNYPYLSDKINLEGLKADMYIARLFDGRKWVTSKVLKN